MCKWENAKIEIVTLLKISSIIAWIMIDSCWEIL